jgi:poly(3-hydroxybutyrate) depolymerase
LGRKLSLTDIKVPLYLLAGESDDITTREQVFEAEHLVGTPRSAIVKKLATRGSHRFVHGHQDIDWNLAGDRP